MTDKPTFSAIRYAYDVSDEESVVVEMSDMFGESGMPEIYVVVSDVMYFTDKRGYVMMCPVSGDWSDVPDAHDVADWSDIPADVQDNRKWAVNVKYFDESNYGALVPVDVESAVNRVMTALSVLHGFGAFATFRP